MELSRVTVKIRIRVKFRVSIRLTVRVRVIVRVMVKFRFMVRVRVKAGLFCQGTITFIFCQYGFFAGIALLPMFLVGIFCQYFEVEPFFYIFGVCFKISGIFEIFAGIVCHFFLRFLRYFGFRHFFRLL